MIENIQWMDDASWNIIESLMCDNSAPRHMLVTGFEEIRSAFMLRTALADEPFEKFEITLRRFNLEETGRICHEMAPDEEWSNERIHDVYMQTEGNPFFIKELLKYKLDGIIDGAAPYKNAYLSMIELLDENERLFLEAIAVCPECASMREISRVLEISPLQVSKFFNNLRLHGFLREQESGEGDVLYYFTHTKIREALLDGMSVSRKVALHAKNMEILEALTPPVLQYRHKKICSRPVSYTHLDVYKRQGDHAAVEMRLAYAPDGVSRRDLGLSRFRGADGDRPDVGSADEALGVSEVHRVLHRRRHFGRALGGRLAAHEILKQRSAETVKKGFLQVSHAGLLVDVGAEVGVGAEEVEGTAFLILYRADLEPALIMAGADHILGALCVEHFVDFALRKLHDAVGILVIHAD